MIQLRIEINLVEKYICPFLTEDQKMCQKTNNGILSINQMCKNWFIKY